MNDIERMMKQKERKSHDDFWACAVLAVCLAMIIMEKCWQ